MSWVKDLTSCFSNDVEVRPRKPCSLMDPLRSLRKSAIVALVVTGESERPLFDVRWISLGATETVSTLARPDVMGSTCA